MPKRIEDEVASWVNVNNAKYADKKASYLARLRYDLRRLASGACRWPGCKEPRLTQWCENHRAHINAGQSRNYAKRKVLKGGA